MYSHRVGDSILLLDFLDMTPLGWSKFHDHFAEVARVFVGKQAPVSVFALSWNGLVRITPANSDPDSLLEAAEKWKSAKNRRIDTGAPRPVRPESASDIYRMLALYGVTVDHAPRDVIDTATQQFDTDAMVLAAIHEIAGLFRGQRGRKKLIWMASDIPTYLKHADDKLALTELSLSHSLALKALTDANISVYPVIANQLVAFGGMDSCGNAVSPDFYLVYETGGSVCDDTPQSCVRRAIDDSNHYYLLGFYLPHNVPAGWHRLEVKVDRAKSDVRSKRRFFVAPALHPAQRSFCDSSPCH